MSSKESTKKYQTVFTKAYSEEYSFIIASKKDKSYAFCTICTCDFSIASGGKYDICKHIAQQKHQDSARILGTNKKKIDFVTKQNDYDVIQAESLFTAFIVEHNLPIACPDPTGPLFRKVFPDGETAKKYGCARTKTSAIIAEMG
ncbi:hypothetical protein AVEN_2833-1 [Araneus ventricosus]|uniref:Uncharacterized protein n=1 Tax=Araneus ventricosus TaxID=182803 RepID=A0A4Y2EL98_ARAVE|nr:hypothetical protein AVEN_2833-1 [Araneus ventricosus]